MSEDKVYAASIIGVIFLIGCLYFGIRACTVADKATFGKMEQKVDTDNYYQSQAYREGLRRDCDELKLAYYKASTPEEKAAILTTLRHRVDGAPQEFVPQDIRILLNGAQ